MIPGGPVQSYLKDLQRELPYPAPRLLVETREHLLEATSLHITEGRDEIEAESLAVHEFGPISEVIDAVLAEGSALMSPKVLRWIAPLAALLAMPAAVFMSVIALEHLAGSDGSEGVFGSTFDAWTSQINVLLVVGPVAALTLIVVSSVRIRRERGVAGFQGAVELKMSRAMVLVTATILLIVLAALAYWIAENFEQWNFFFRETWSCTIENGRQVCSQG